MGSAYGKTGLAFSICDITNGRISNRNVGETVLRQLRKSAVCGRESSVWSEISFLFFLFFYYISNTHTNNYITQDGNIQKSIIGLSLTMIVSLKNLLKHVSSVL